MKGKGEGSKTRESGIFGCNIDPSFLTKLSRNLNLRFVFMVARYNF